MCLVLLSKTEIAALHAQSLCCGRAWRAGIIGGLLSYCILNGTNWLLDKASELLHTPIAGTDPQPNLTVTRSFIGRIASNTGGAQQVPVWDSGCTFAIHYCCLIIAKYAQAPCRIGPLCISHPCSYCV